MAARWEAQQVYQSYQGQECSNRAEIQGQSVDIQKRSVERLFGHGQGGMLATSWLGKQSFAERA